MEQLAPLAHKAQPELTDSMEQMEQLAQLAPLVLPVLLAHKVLLELMD
jgi:hypothetical protein